MNKPLLTLIKLTLALSVTLTLVGCGQKGPLTLPQPPEQNEKPQQSQTP